MSASPEPSPDGFQRKMRVYVSHGVRTFTPSPVRSFTLRVTSVKSCSRAVAAMTPSMLGSGFPLSNAWAERPVSDCFGYREKPFFKPLLQIALQPSFQLRAAFSWRKPLDSLANFPKAKNACPQQIRIGGFQPRSDLRVGSPSPLEFRQDVGIEKKPAHSSNGRP